jgi:putative acetyltransferase
MSPPAVRHRDSRHGPDDVRYRAERPEDHRAISEVVAAAFGSQAEAELVGDIRASEYFIAELSMVAQCDERLVGHVMVSYATLLGQEGERRIAMLSPLAVHPACRRRGIGSALVRTVTAHADALGEPLVILEGNPRFYGRLGFEHSLRYGIHITLPSWAPPEAAQVLRLSSYTPSVRGRVKYPAAFDRFTEH